MISTKTREMSLVALLAAAAEQRGERIAYTFLADGERPVDRITWSELDRRARWLAVELVARGARGQRVLLVLPPGIDFVAAFFGCLYAGAVAVPVDPPQSARTLPRLLSIAADCKPALVLVAKDRRRRLEQLCEGSGAAGPGAVAPHWLSWDGSDVEAVAGAAADWSDPGVDGETLAFLQYTSGSTSAPKGVEVCHRNLLHNEELIRRAFEVTPESVIVGWLPLFHDMGLIGNVLQPLYAGASCHLMSPMAFLARPARWLQAISDQRATISGGPDFAYDLCARRISAEEREGLDLSSWRVAFSGAEPVRAATLERFAAAFADCGFDPRAFYPCYGLAEATLFVTGGEVARPPRVAGFDTLALEERRVVADDGEGSGSRHLVGCGTVSPEQRLLIVDPQTRRPLPENQVGEIWLAGPSVARGYWGRPGLSENELAARLDLAGDDDTFLRTGDVGFLHHGELFVAGRLKDLIIIRGRNHYPQDLESTAEGAHEVLLPGGCAAFSLESEGEERLVLVAEAHRHVGDRVAEAIDAVRQAVAEGHEIRAHDVVVIRAGTLPRTTSGKLRRRACHAAYLEGTLSVVGGGTGPGSEPELGVDGEASALDGLRRRLLDTPKAERAALLTATLCSEIGRRLGLGVSAVDPRRPVTVLGLDSLGAVELEHALRSRGGLPLAAADLLAGEPLEALISNLLEGLDSTTSEQGETLAATPVGPAVHPLSLGQEGLLARQRLAPRSTAYTIAAAVRIEPALDLDALGRALEQLALRHPLLRATVEESGGEPRLRIHDVAEVELEVETTEGEVGSDTAKGNDPAVLARLDSRAREPFDLARGPLLRLVVVRTPVADSVMLAIHHLIADFWSLAVLTRELESLYGRAAAGESIADGGGLAPLVHTFGDLATRQRRLYDGGRGAENDAGVESSWSWWRRHLAPLPEPLEIPADRPRSATPSHRGGVATLPVPSSLRDAIEALGRTQGVTVFATMLAFFQGVLCRFTGRRDFLLAAPSSGRDDTEMAPLVGYFVNPLVLRADLGEQPSLLDLVRRSGDEVAAVFAHRGLPFAELTRRLRAEYGDRATGLDRVIFTLEQPPAGAPEALAALAVGWPGASSTFAGHRLESLALPESATDFDLALRVAPVEGAWVFSLQYALDLYDTATAERLLAALGNLLEIAATEPGARLEGLSLLGAAERRQIELWSAPGEIPLEPWELVHRRLAEQARHQPDSPAVVGESSQLTYDDLERRSNQLARWLCARGVEPETRVAVLASRSPELVIAQLAVLKAGGAYLPLDSAYPEERLRFQVENAGAALVLVHGAEIGGELGAGVSNVVLADLADEIETLDDGPIDRVIDEKSLAYVIYTSGSTGVPKGVAVSHRSLASLVDWHLATHGPGPGDRIASTAGLAFDALVWELWPSLAAGATLVLSPEAARHLPSALVEWLAREAVDLAFLATPLAEAVMEELTSRPLAERPPLALRTLLTGGDRLRRRPEADFGFELVNHYGPTENTVVAVAGAVEPAVADGGALPSLGRPIAHVGVELLGRDGVPVPLGAVGEIALTGRALARGYLGGARETAARFVPADDPTTPGARRYLTGDLARWSPVGGLDFLGRADHQVQVRGYRVEPGEIEAVLESHPAVARAAVLPHPDLAGGLAAFVVAASTDAPVVEDVELEDYLRHRLPEPMVPRAYERIAALPLTANGKIDRRALASHRVMSVERSDAGPRTAIESEVASLAAALLEVDAVALDRSFFAAGGHSLLATRLAARLRDLFGVELPLATVFDAPSLRHLAATIEAALSEGDAASRERIPRAPGRDRQPVSFAQQRLWVIDRNTPQRAAAYNIPGAIDLEGAVDPEALRLAFAAVLERHQVLTGRFDREGRDVVQVLADEDRGPELEFRDLRRIPETHRDRRLAAIEEQVARELFDLGTGPLLRAVLLQIGDERFRLLVTFHHIVADGLSMAIFLDELAAFYRGFLLGEDASPSLEPLAIQYGDYAAWQRDWLSGQRLEGLLDYWRRQLASLEVLDLPTDRPRRGPGDAAEPAPVGRCRLDLTAAGEVVEHLGRSHGVTPFMAFAAALGVVLARWTGRDDLVLGTPIANRGQREVEPLIGLFVNTLALRFDLTGAPSWNTVLERVRRTALDAYAHQDLPFEKVVETLAPEHLAHASPIFQVLLSSQETRPATLDLPGVVGRPRALESGRAKFDLTVRIDRSEGIWGLEAEYDAALFDALTIARWLRAVERVLRSGATTPERDIWALDLLEAGEREQALITSPTRSGASHEGPGTVHGRFSEQAARTPAAVAVACGDAELTFLELDRRSDQLARRLIDLGVAVGDRVALCFRRRPEQYIGVFGILKAGAAMVPLDPEAPEERSAVVVEQAGCRLLVSDDHFRDSLGDLCEIFVAGDDPQAGEELSDEVSSAALPSLGGPRDLAYVLFTSGSTGMPKGVMVEHHSLLHLVEALRQSAYVGLAPGRRVVVNAPLVFDAAVKQWLQVLHGDRLELIPAPVRQDPRRMVGFLARRQVHVLDVTPTQLRYLLPAGLLRECGTLERVLVGGEAIDDELWDRLAANPGARFYNVYGPTECTVDSTWSVISREVAEPRLGDPLPGVRLAVLDRRLEPVLPGASGELVIAGAGVARGYLGRPALTATCFVPDPWSSEPGARQYRSGDRVRRRHDGGLEFLGRIDRQVKLRGFRLELGEVEAAISSQPKVREAAVRLVTSEGVEPRLVAYVVASGEDPSPAIDLENLHSGLARRLPSPMVPAVFVVLDRLPRTPSGKVDRKVLPDPGTVETLGSEERGGGAPRTPVEEVLAGMMCEILGLDKVSIHDNFFELGGHSLLAAELNALVQDAFEIEVPMFQILLEAPTVASIAEYLVEDPERRQQVESMAPVLLELAEEPGDAAEDVLVGGVP